MPGGKKSFNCNRCESKFRSKKEVLTHVKSSHDLSTAEDADDDEAGLATNSIFSVSFLWKIIALPGGQINDPSSGKHYSLPFLPATPSSPSRTLDSPRALLPELQRYKDTVRCAALGAEVPGHCQQQLTQTLIVRLLKTHFFYIDPWFWKVNRAELSQWPDLDKIRVNCLAPGTIETPAFESFIMANGKTKEGTATLRRAATNPKVMKRLGQPEEIASAALFLASGKQALNPSWKEA